MKLIELLSGTVTEYLPSIVSITTPNDWSFCVRFTNDCQATFSHYGLEHQVEKLSRALRHARQTHRKISSINLIPEHNIRSPENPCSSPAPNFFSGPVPPVSPNFPPNGTPGFHKILPMSEFCSFSMRNESAKTHRTLANKAVPVILRYDI